jgi:hypothetical protein
MSRDKYSNDHTIELFHGKSLTVETSGDNGAIGLTTSGVNGHINLQTGSGQEGGSISLRALGDVGGIDLVATETALTLYSGSGISLSAPDITVGASNDITISADGAMSLSSSDGFLFEGGGSVSMADGLDVTGGLACDSLSIAGQTDFVTGATGWDDVQAESRVRISTDDADGITILADKHVAIISSAGQAENRGCEIGGYSTKVKGKFIYIGRNYDPDNEFNYNDNEFNNKWEDAHGSGLPCSYVKIEAETEIVDAVSDGAVLTVSNTTSSLMNQGVRIQLNSEGTYAGADNFAPHTARWLDFRWGRPPLGTGQDEQYIAGMVRGTIHQDVGYGYGFLSTTTGPGAPSNIVYYEYAAVATSPNLLPDDGNDPMRSSPGNAQFVSGLADFGEFFEAGDISEWPEACEYRKSEKALGGDPAIVGLQEGMVVWVHGNKFYKIMKGDNCIPMFITKRSIVTGDGGAILSEEGLGEVLSFCGKLPIVIKGATSPGDYIIPEDNENYCYAVSNSDVTFAQYKKAMGRALSGCKNKVMLSDDHPLAPGQETEFSVILCAVGIK